MFLKLRLTNDWKIIPNIEEIEYRAVAKKHLKDNSEVRYKGDTGIESISDLKSSRVLLARITTKSKVISVASDKIAYLCNDEGKTIEKIN